MKKILSLFALVLLSCMGAWAQTPSYVKGAAIDAQSDLKNGDLVILGVKSHGNTNEAHLMYAALDPEHPYYRTNYRAHRDAHEFYDNNHVWKVVNVNTSTSPATFQLQSLANEAAFLPNGNGFSNGSAAANIYLQEVTAYDIAEDTRDNTPRFAIRFTNATNNENDTYHFNGAIGDITDSNNGNAQIGFWGAPSNIATSGTWGAYAFYKAETITYTSAITPTYVSTNGATGNEGAAKMVDGNVDTKWGQGSLSSGPYYVILKAGESPVCVKGYSLWNGNDTFSWQGRRATAWKLQGSNDANGEWHDIDVRSDEEMLPENNKPNTYKAENSESYIYYKLTVEAIDARGLHADMFQFSEFKLYIDLPDNYSVEFDTNTTYTGNDLAWQRAIKSITIGGVTKNVAEYSVDNNSNSYAAYRDLTETCVFNIATGEALNAKITIGSTDNCSWSDTYIYIDTNGNGRFTIADPNELFASLTGAGAVTNFNNSFENRQSVPATEGTYRMRIVLGAQEPAGNATFTSDMNRIVDVTLKVLDVAGLQNKIDDIMNAIYADAVGYPNRNNATNTSAINNLHDFQSMSAALKPVNATNYDQALAALNAVYPLTDVNFPIPGKAYTIAFRKSDGTLKYIAEGGDNVFADDKAGAAVFVAGNTDDATYNLLFVDKAGEYLRYHGASTTQYQQYGADFKCGAMVSATQDHMSNAYKSAEYLFGTVYLTANSRNSESNGNDGCLILEESNNLGNNSAEPFLNGTYTSALVIEEVDFPYTNKTLNAGGDGFNYGTVYLPYAMRIPEGVTAYAATAEGEVLTLTEATEDSQIVEAGAYILVSAVENATSAAILPAAANPTTVGNELQGSITTAPSGDIYVLNKVDGVGFYKFNGDDYNTLLGKAYLPSTAKANKLAFRYDDVITAISAIESNNSGAEIFDLQGRRLNKAQKGMNIINGHKVLVK